ncbi:MAG: DUF1592 domain-containing protein [Myxococcota bacterium]
MSAPWLVVVPLLAACTGEISDAPAPPPLMDAPIEGEGPDGLPELRHSPGVRLLSADEYRSVVLDLFDVVVNDAPGLQVVAGHGAITLAQAVGYDDVEAYYELGLGVAEQVVDGLDLECGAPETQCAEQWVAPVLRRALHREDADVERYLSILAEPAAGDDVSSRLTTLIAALLSSPDFLYRRELGRGRVARGVRELADVEIAQRMSFLLWQTAPDEALLAAAAAGELRSASGRRVHFMRMFADPRTRRGLRTFVADWMALNEGGIDSKDPEVLEGVAANLSSAAATSFDATVDRVLLDAERSFPALLGTDVFVGSQEVGDVIGTRSGAGEHIDLNVAERRGILTHPHVIAAHTKESGASPFPIGKFVNEQFLCELIDPPPMIPEVDEEELEGETFRERMESRTASPACQGCHERIGPPGFAFLNFDPIGRYRAADSSGIPFDASGSLRIGNDLLPFANAGELAAVLADHPVVARCTARRLFRWTFGHFEHEDDGGFVSELEDVSVGQAGAVQALLEALVTSETFSQVRIEP